MDKKPSQSCINDSLKAAVESILHAKMKRNTLSALYHIACAMRMGEQANYAPRPRWPKRYSRAKRKRLTAQYTRREWYRVHAVRRALYYHMRASVLYAGAATAVKAALEGTCQQE
jgi:hypothetical protein